MSICSKNSDINLEVTTVDIYVATATCQSVCFKFYARTSYKRRVYVRNSHGPHGNPMGMGNATQSGAVYI